MANVCSNSICVTGPKEKLEKLHRKIKNQSDDILSLCEDFGKGQAYGLFELTHNGDSVNILIDSRWSEVDLSVVSEAYPELEFENEFEEGSCDYYGVSTYEDGSVITEELTRFQWLLRNNGDIKAIIEDIQTLPYDQFKEQYLKEDWIDEELLEQDSDWEYFEPFIAARTEKEDLPLLLGFFEGEHGKMLLNKRFAGKEITEDELYNQ